MYEGQSLAAVPIGRSGPVRTLLAIFSLGLLAGPTVAHAVPALDQANDAPFTGFAAIAAEYRAQTFTVGRTGVLSRFEVQLFGVGATGSAVFEIWSTASGRPVAIPGTALGSATLSFSGVNHAFVSAELTPGIPVNEGDVLALVLKGGAFQQAYWDYSSDPNNPTADPYTRGSRFTTSTSDPTGPWIPLSGFPGPSDFNFRTYVEIAPAAINDGPVAVTEGVGKGITVGSNDYGFTNPVSVAVTTLPTKGTITGISPPGPVDGMAIAYTANIGTAGSDSFVYTMTDSTAASDSATVTVNISPDTDGDGVPDGSDNCTLVANTSQCDSDTDGYGNRCDGDLNDNGATTAQDTVLFRQELGQPSVAPGYNKADINCSGAVNAQDTALFRQFLGQMPGPSGQVP
jgi:hypothetical protein